MTMTFDKLNPTTVTIDGIEIAAAYTIDRAARAVTVAWYHPETLEQISRTIRADDPDYLPARHTARAYYKETGEKLPEKPYKDPVFLKPDASRPWIGETIKGRGYEIRFSGMEHRTMILFKRRPCDRVVKAMKEAGFHYSPNREAWIAKLDNAHHDAAQRLTLIMDAGL